MLVAAVASTVKLPTPVAAVALLPSCAEPAKVMLGSDEQAAILRGGVIVGFGYQHWLPIVKTVPMPLLTVTE